MILEYSCYVPQGVERDVFYLNKFQNLNSWWVLSRICVDPEHYRLRQTNYNRNNIIQYPTVSNLGKMKIVFNILCTFMNLGPVKHDSEIGIEDNYLRRFSNWCLILATQKA
jgi:hypothetical protein